MTKKAAKSPKNPPTTITLTLPDENGLARTGTLLIQRGTLAALRQFTYRDLGDITRAIQGAAAQLMALEQNPPPDFPTKATTPATSSPSEPEPDDMPVDDRSEIPETLEQESGEVPHVVSDSSSNDEPASTSRSENDPFVTLPLF